MDNNNNNITIYFKKNIIKNINVLYFKINEELEYINNSHINYLYELEKNDKVYKFYGFYKDDYFVVITEIYDNLLKNIIYDKQIILIKINWIKKNINDRMNLYFLDIQKNNYNYIYAPLRKEILNSNDLLIDDLLIINDYNIEICNIKTNQENNDYNIEKINDIYYSKNIFKKISNKILNKLF